jgi:hypothetical protein
MTISTDATAAEFGDDLTYSLFAPRDAAGGTWIAGRVAGHRFEALAFRGHAPDPAWEMSARRITKLWVQRLADQAVVFEWDRGPVRPAADAATTSVVDFLVENLAEDAFGE